MIFNLYHRSARDALRFRLRHIDGRAAQGAQSFAEVRTASCEGCPATALDKARRERL
jgi:hypothetical protein